MDRFLKSKFKTGKKLSESPFSITYSGTTLSGEQPVVIKIYKRGALNSALIKSMKQKVKILQEMIDPRVVPILDGDYGWQGFYYVRPFIPGQTLEEYMQNGKMDVSEAENIMIQVCEALAAAHKKGIVHGALKSRNIILSKEGIKLIDFVIEGEVLESPPQKALAIMQDYENISPEEISGKGATASSDIFAAGVLLYKMAAGQNPFPTKIDRLHGNFAPPQNIPQYLLDILQKALTPDPLLRFRDASMLAESLKIKTIAEPRRDLDLPPIELENTPHPKDVEVETVSQERKKSFFLAVVIFLSTLAGIIYAIINSLWMR